MKMMFEVEVDASSFFNWADRAVANVKRMSDTLKEIRAIYHHEIVPFTPLKDSYLDQSLMQFSEVSGSYPFFELHLKMSGVNNPKADGWDYALIQAEAYPNKRIRGTTEYMEKGMNAADGMVWMQLETDYLSALGV